ncbi:Uma2 family endonuclease [Streptomyces sp. NPDC051940]|uniref:Uma2 family endonuclease n=1 Tax=Streptomyces sp. NPDC051940 TaxID=3155675 RepID=UPI003421F97A
MSVAPKREQHDWPMPPDGGWTADDLDTLPDLPPHTELIDGSLVFVSPQARFHMLTMRVLERGLLRTLPDDLDVVREMTVTLRKQQRPEPDLMVARAEADTGPEQTSLLPEDVLLVVEVVSRDSEARDRETKPLKYAKAGIPHLWRVESKRGKPVVYVYELDPANGSYHLTGIHRDRLQLSAPYDIDIDLNARR